MRKYTNCRAMRAALAFGLCCLGPSALAMQAEPDVIYITGLVRDFHASHADFNVLPVGGSGHYALNVKLGIGDRNRPEFRGGGFAVNSQWRDRELRPIPPHLYAGGAGLVKLVSAPVFAPSAKVDTWDSSVGPYGGANVGPEPTFYVGAEMPTISEPTGLPPNAGVVSYDGSGTTTLAADLHCDELHVKDLHRLRIVGDVTILCEQKFIMRDGGSIELAAGATLTLYTKGIVKLVDSTVNANTTDPSRFQFYHLGSGNVELSDGAEIYASLVAPDGGLHIADQSDFYGTYSGETLNVVNVAGFHLDARMPLDACGVRLDDSVGDAGITSNGGITAASTFEQWYEDVLGVNLSMPHTIGLVRDNTGVYEFLSDSFYPIDGTLFGNEGDSHNYYFTFTFTAQFTYSACGGQFVEFMGADDAWLFVGDDLAMDLGGILPGTDQYVELDRLALEDGVVYTMNFFYAQRNPTMAVFRLRTNVPLITPELMTVSAGFD